MHHLDAFARSRIEISRDDAKECEVLMELRFEVPRNLEWVSFRGLGLSEEFVLIEVFAHVSDISDVLYETDVKSFELQSSADDVGEEKCAQVAKMGIPIDSGSTAVDPHFFTIRSDDLSKAASEGVIDSNAGRYSARHEVALSTMRNAKTWSFSNVAIVPSLRLTLPGEIKTPSRSR